jgi:hypothetical protein
MPERGRRADRARLLLTVKVAMSQHKGTTLWMGSNGIGCVLLPYDDTRVQLRLVRQRGTIKADLFRGYEDALAASQRWREELESGTPAQRWP